MKVIAGLVLLLMAVPQDGAQDENQDPTARMTDWIVGRLKDQLDLDDDQTEKVKGVFGEMRKKQDDKIRDVLTDDQKEKFKGVAGAMGMGGREGRGGRGGGFQNMGGGAFAIMRQFRVLGRLKEELELTDEQVEKVQPLVEEVSEEAQEKMAELREEGFQGVDWEELQKEWKEKLDDLKKKVGEHLTDKQKEKLNTLFEGGGRRRGNNRDNRRRSSDDQLKQAMKELDIENADEKEAIQQLIERTIKAREAVSTGDRESRETLDELAKNEKAEEDEVQKALESIRSKRSELQKSLRESRKGLREVVSFRQELVLVRMGILE